MNRPAPSPPERILRHDWALAGCLYVAVAVAYFYPLLPHFSTAVLGDLTDNIGYLWTLWWGHRALLGDWSQLTFTDAIYFPEGTSLAFHVYSWYNLFVALPLRAFLSLPAVYNVLQLHTFVLAGLGAFALARHVTRNSAVSLVAGYVYAFNPVHYAYSLLHINSSSIEFIPFFVLFFLRAIQRRSRVDVAAAAGCFLLNAMCSWYYLTYALLFVGLAYLYLAWRRRQLLIPSALATSAAVVGLGLLPLAPWLAFMVTSSLGHPGALETRGHDLYVADLLAFFVPHHEHLLADWAPIERLNSLYTGRIRAGSTAYLGWANLLLAAVALRGAKPAVAKYAWGGLAFALLAMGSHLHIAGEVLPLPLPNRLLEWLPFFSTMRVPNRAMAFVYLFLAVLTAVGLSRLHGSLAPGWRRSLLSAGAVALIFLDYYTLATGRTELSVSAVYAEIPRGGEREGLLDLPLTTNRAIYMAYQTEHGIPIVAGFVGRKLEGSLVEQLAGKTPTALMQLLRERDVRWIVLHKDPREGRERTLSYGRALVGAGAKLVAEDADAILLHIE